MRFAKFWTRRRTLFAQWTPFAILLAAMLAWLAMGLDRDYFYRPQAHSSQSAETLAMADNLSPSRAFLIFRRAYLRADGETGYAVYSRFPLGGYALVKLAMMPFESDLAAKILAARALTLAMFGGAAALFYLALARLLANRWAALGAVALAFSGHHLLYYSDMIDTERTMGVFGIALTFHGMAVFVREGRVRQLALKAGAAVLLDWQALALLLPFAVFGAAGEALRAARSARSADGERAGKGARMAWAKARAADFFSPTAISAIAATARAAVLGAARARQVMVAAVALAVAVAAMVFNLANEYAALGGETPISEIPTVRSAAIRLSGEVDGGFSWARFLRTELHRAGAAHMSLALPGYGDGLVRMGGRWDGLIIAAGSAALAVCAAAVFWARKRAPLLAPLALSVFIWDLAIRQYVIGHIFQSPFHFAPALALFSVAMLCAGERFGARVSAALALAAAAVFTLGAFQMNALSHDDEAEKALVADFQAMREIARGKVVYFDPSIRENMSAGFPHDAAFFLPGATIISFNYEDLIQPDAMQPVIEAADLVLSRDRFAGIESLTPGNREAFLYDPRDVAAMRLAEYRAVATSGEPAARAVFDLYADEDGGGALVYAKRPCAAADTRTRFFLHAYAADFDDLPRNRRLQGFEGLDFHFGERGAIFADACMARANLSDYALSKIDTGQFTSDGGRTWSAELRFDIDDYLREVYTDAKSREPSARSVFDVYLTRGALTYVKEPCAAEDARGRFLVSVFPSDKADLEDGREAIGHNSLNFSFAEYGGMINGRCVIRRPLPEYTMERLEVGQWIPGGERLWSADISVRD